MVELKIVPLGKKQYENDKNVASLIQNHQYVLKANQIGKLKWTLN
jgi:hypothetical protein